MITDEEADRILHAMGLDLEALQYLELAARHLKAAEGMIANAAHLQSNIGSDLLFTKIVDEIQRQRHHLEQMQE